MNYLCSKKYGVVLAVLIMSLSCELSCFAAAESPRRTQQVQQTIDRVLEQVENTQEVVDKLVQAETPSQAFGHLIGQHAFDALPGIEVIRANTQGALDMTAFSEEQQDNLREWHSQMADLVQQYPRLNCYIQQLGDILEPTIGSLEEVERIVEEIDAAGGDVSTELKERLHTQLDRAEGLVDTTLTAVSVLSVVPGFQAPAAAAASVLIVAQTSIKLVREVAQTNVTMIKAACHVAKISVHAVKSTVIGIKNWFVGLLSAGETTIDQLEAQIAPGVGEVNAGADVNVGEVDPQIAVEAQSSEVGV